ncbi:MAG: hypothetical protein QOF02_631 [Blastocatellia bacterium]|jgi:hypothetical protein|nr:hypothetical protein [Blastocatellia bacterium]
MRETVKEEFSARGARLVRLYGNGLRQTTV